MTITLRHRRRPLAAPSFSRLHPASVRASKLARASSKKRDTQCELALARAFVEAGVKPSPYAKWCHLPGKPDFVFPSPRTVVFCDGDFWHGRGLRERLHKVSAGHNAQYWVAKLRTNIRRDRRNNASLRRAGWRVIRAWEGDIRRRPELVACRIRDLLASPSLGDVAPMKRIRVLKPNGMARKQKRKR